MRRVCLVGAGFIAGVHAEALRSLPGLAIVAIADSNVEAAQRLAQRFGVARTHAGGAEALAAGGIDVAHILVPPDVHVGAALPFLEAGVPAFVEKPLAASLAGCRRLLEAAASSGAALAVNQNFVFHPAFAALRKRLGSGEFGRPRFVECIYNLPLAQLSARQFGHWMFHAPGNILLEQAVHPLSQIATIAGPVRALRAVADPAKEIAPGLDFHPGATVALDCQHMPAQLRFAVGESFPFWRVTVVCDDAIATADILGNHVEVHARTRWMEPADAFVSTQRRAFSLAWSGWRNAFAYGLSTLRLVGRNDPFFLSMKGSIAAFHGALGTGRRIETDGAFGTMLAEACEAIHDQAFAPRPAAPSLAASPAPRVAPPGQGASAEVAVLGGTGFIGTETVRRFVASGLRVRVMARSLRNLPAVFRDPMVELHRGDIRDAGAVARAIGDAPLVVNLAHGGGGENFEAVRAAMVGGAETVARACLAAKVRRLVHVGSIASLYLGPEAGVVTGATPSDPRAEERADYSRAKAICDEMLLTMHARQGLPVVILRPGLVVGEGTSPFHAGLGLFNNDQHCIGWNAGRNPLPFVLVDDVAQAILLAVRAQAIEGRCYNLVGDVRPDARGYIRDLAQALGRPLQFHAQSPMRLWLTDLGKWLIKRAGGRAAPLPSRREFVSRGLMAPFDCADARRDLGWSPVSDPAVFARGAIAVHVR